VLQGIRDQANFVKVRDHLLKFHLFQNGGKEVAIKAAQNYRSLRGQGYTIRRTIDCLIATFCLEAGHTLLHRDRYFDAFEKALGMKVVHA
jgi:predicted nucleic acid-binding protein